MTGDHANLIATCGACTVCGVLLAIFAPGLFVEKPWHPITPTAPDPTLTSPLIVALTAMLAELPGVRRTPKSSKR